jgi:hypothetical protein
LHTVVRSQTQNFFKSGHLINNKKKNTIPFELHGHRIYVAIKSNDQPRSYNFILDTGAFNIIFPLSFLSKFSYSAQKKFIESKDVFVRWPWTSIEKNYIGRIDELQIGSLKLQNIPAIFANTEDIILGKEFLSQCIMTIDYPGQQLILKPYHKFTFKDNYFTTGLKLNKNKQNKTFVEAIWRGSPADQAGLDLNDEILKINSRDTKSLSLQEISNILNDDRIPRIEIVSKKSFSERTVILNKKPLLPL